jgi:hypothetical protein
MRPNKRQSRQKLKRVLAQFFVSRKPKENI